MKEQKSKTLGFPLTTGGNDRGGPAGLTKGTGGPDNGGRAGLWAVVSGRHSPRTRGAAQCWLRETRPYGS